AGECPWHRGEGRIGEVHGSRGGALLVRAGHRDQPADGVIGVADDLTVLVGRGEDLGGFEIMRRRRDVAEAVGYAFHVDAYDVVVSISKTVALAVEVGGTEHAGELALAVIGHVGDGGRAAREEAAVLGDVRGGAVHVVFAAAQRVAGRVGGPHAGGDAGGVACHAGRVSPGGAAGGGGWGERVRPAALP